MEISPLEERILEALLSEDPEKEIFGAQVANLRVANREYTGVGLFTKFDVHRELAKLRDGKNDMETFPATFLMHPELDAGATVILWLRDGFISTLECKTVEKEWPSNEALFKVIT